MREEVENKSQKVIYMALENKFQKVLLQRKIDMINTLMLLFIFIKNLMLNIKIS
jgi:hypothetical protein